MNKVMKAGIAALLSAVAMSSMADNVLVVHGLSTTSETGTTQENINNWPVVCNAQNQHTVTYLDSMPADLSPYQQIWDIRFDNASALTGSEMGAYANALASGASFFLMGENSGFMDRNNSVIQFANQVGGGQLTFDSSNGASTTPQTVYAPLDTNGLQTVNFAAGGTATVAGLTGAMATVDATVGAGNSGTTFFWKRGTLGNAPAGQLAIVFDVNFMMTSYASYGNNGQLFANLCEQLSVPPPTISVVADGGASTVVNAGGSLPVDVLANDTAQGDTIAPATVSVVTPPAHGSISLIDSATGIVTYSAAAGYEGPDQFEYKVCLQNTPATCGTAVVSLNVVLPTISPQDDGGASLVVAAGQTTAIAVLANDTAQGDAIDPASMTISVAPGKGTIESTDPVTGAVTYKANAGASGVDSFTYSVCLKANPGVCGTAVVTVNVRAGDGAVRAVPASDFKLLAWMTVSLVGLYGFWLRRNRHIHS